MMMAELLLETLMGMGMYNRPLCTRTTSNSSPTDEVLTSSMMIAQLHCGLSIVMVIH